MKKYKEIITEQFGSSINDLSKIQTSSQNLSNFGAGKQTLTSLSATQAQAPLQTAYTSATRQGNAITQYKQGNVKAQKNYFGTNVTGKKPIVSVDDAVDVDAIARPDLTFVPSSIEKLPTTPFTSKDLDDAIKSGDVNRIAQTISGDYAGAAFRTRDLLKGVVNSLLGRTGESADGPGTAMAMTTDMPVIDQIIDDVDSQIDAELDLIIPEISFGIANTLAGLYFKVEDYEAQREAYRDFLEKYYGDADGDGIPGNVEELIGFFVNGGFFQELMALDPELLASFGVDVNMLQQFIDFAYGFDPNSPDNYSPEFIQFLRIYLGLDPLIDPNIPAPGGNGGNGRPPSSGNGNGLPPVNPGGGTSPSGRFV